MSEFKRIDIHAHVNFPDFEKDREEVIRSTLDSGTYMINIGTGRNTSEEVVRLAEKYEEGVYAIIGLHPMYVKEGFDKNYYKRLLESKKVVGIGECGLDYFHIEGDINKFKDLQRKVFEDQIDLAIEYDLPIMIHCRDAYRDILETLNAKSLTLNVNQNLRGNIHFFAGTVGESREFLDLGFTISFTGVITFAKQYEELVKLVPLDKMHAETDCPYVAPVPNRGQRNEPSYVIHVINKIAEIKGLPVEEVERQLVENARKLFKI